MIEIKHFNVSVSDALRRIFNPKGGSDFSSFNPTIQPIVDIRDRANIVRSNTRSTTGTGTILTTPSDKDFYLTTLSFSATADATADNTVYSIATTIEGAARNILQLVKTSLTAYENVATITFSPPIKIDRNVTITLGSTFTVGTSNCAATLTGFTQEVTK